MSETQLVTNQNTLQVQWQQLDQPAPTGQLDCTNGTEVSQENGRENVAIEPKRKIGRPVSLTEAYRYILARDGALAYAEVIAKDAKEATRASDRLAAATEMEDRASGKAVQNIRHAGIFMVLAPGEEVLSAAFGALPPSEDE